MLQAFGLNRKIQHTRRYRVTDKGFAFMSAAVHLRHHAFLDDMALVS